MIKQNLAGILGRKLSHLYRYLVPRPLTASEKSFIGENRAFWSRYTGSGQAGPAPRYVLVEPNSHPITLLCNASFAAMVSLARNLKPLFVLSSRRDRSISKIMESYCPGSAFVYTDSWRYVLSRILARFRAGRVFRKLKSPRDILAFRVDGIRFGDLVYDSVLRSGYATIGSLDGRARQALQAYFWHRYVIKDIIRRYKLETSVFSHIIGLNSGVFARYLLQSGVEVLNRTGSHQVQVKKYKHVDEVGFYPLRPEPQYFSFMMNRSDNAILQRADKYLHDRLNQNVRHIAVDLAFDRRKRLFDSKEEFCSHFGLDPAKKVIFVMLHAFNDYPHSHFTKPMIYQDYFDWFQRTLEVARSSDSVNWIFKEHPAAEFYPTKDARLDAIFEDVKHPHIRFLNRQADFNSRSLQYIADAIVTCLGTAGLEYSCLGIPCVLAGESPYSGFGFTIEPASIAEYEERLRHIGELKRLGEDQIKAAKIVMFFQLCMIQGDRYLFCPVYDFRKIIEIRAGDLWKDAAELLKTGDKAKMARQIEALTDFIRDASYTQYISLEKYGFMREAVHGGQQPK